MGELQFSPPRWRYEGKDLVHACPVCGGRTRRSRRRFVDRIASLAGPLRRYRCDDRQCGWRGNIALPKQHTARRVPRSFLIWMWLVAVCGVLALMLLKVSVYDLGEALLRWFSPEEGA